MLEKQMTKDEIKKEILSLEALLESDNEGDRIIHQEELHDLRNDLKA